mmetsp:Transcript_21204/g.65207  ORF Transcript_21204/g.65207 Transcript_21204/m.65207 type:complete len:205 (-) Transcript_21204:203-817(-)
MHKSETEALALGSTSTAPSLNSRLVSLPAGAIIAPKRMPAHSATTTSASLATGRSLNDALLTAASGASGVVEPYSVCFSRSIGCLRRGVGPRARGDSSTGPALADSTCAWSARRPTHAARESRDAKNQQTLLAGGTRRPRHDSLAGGRRPRPCVTVKTKFCFCDGTVATVLTRGADAAGARDVCFTAPDVQISAPASRFVSLDD